MIRKGLQRLEEIGRYLVSGWRRPLLMGFFVLLSLIVIAQIIISNWDSLLTYDWQFRTDQFALAIIFFLLDFLLAIWAWHLLVKALANYNNLRQTTKIILQANLARRVPGMVWYIASRSLMYEEVGVAKRTTTLLSGLELLFFLVSGVVTTLLTLPFWDWPFEALNNLSPILLLLIIIPLSVCLVHPRVFQFLWQKIAKETAVSSLSWQNTFFWLIVYILTWILGAFVLYFVINTLHPISSSSLIQIVGIWSLAGTLSLAGFVTISFFGLREVSLALLLTPLLPTPLILIIVVLIRLIWLVGELATSLLSFKL